MITWEPSTSVIVAPARSAMERTASVPTTFSPVETTAQDGRFFQAGTPVGSENADSERGRWVAAIRAVCSTLRSAAKTSPGDGASPDAPVRVNVWLNGPRTSEDGTTRRLGE